VAFAFDTLGYPKHLRENGVAQQQAEAHAEAARQFIMAELVTKSDLQTLSEHFDAKLENLEAKFEAKLDNFEAKFDNLSLRITVRLGILLAAGIAALGVIVRLPVSH
jgi:hypothetical protein